MFLTQIVNGQMTEMCLCAKCAKERGLFDPQSLTFAEKFFPEEFKKKVEQIVQNISAEIEAKTAVPELHPTSRDMLSQCPVCQCTLEDYRRSGRLGCADCYTVFAHEINPEQLPAADSPGATQASPAVTRRMLEKELQDAIQREDYETAALLRDQLNSQK